MFRDLEGRDITERELEVFFEGLDANRDGVIDWTEFLTGLHLPKCGLHSLMLLWSSGS